VSLAAEMPGAGTIGGSQVPLDRRQLLIAALNHEPMDRIFAYHPANLALELFQIRHPISCRKLGTENNQLTTDFPTRSAATANAAGKYRARET
jgi:hypothetical protein